MSGPEWRTFRDESAAAADRLDAYQLIVGKRPDLRDPHLLAEAARIARDLRDYARRFGLWPQLAAETIAFERATMLPELVRMLRRTLEMIDALPTMGLLGPVPRPSSPKKPTDE